MTARKDLLQTPPSLDMTDLVSPLHRLAARGDTHSPCTCTSRRTPSLPGHDRLGLSAAPLTPSDCTGRRLLTLDGLSTPSRK